MCGIAFKKARDFKDYFTLASKRGTDGLGVVSPDLKVSRFYCTSLSTFKKDDGVTYSFPVGDGIKYLFDSMVKFYDHLLATTVKKNKNKLHLIHHRKTTVGTSTIDNVHPFEGDRYIVMQNGTANEFLHWGKCELPDEKDRSDTYFLSQFINRIEFKDIPSRLGSLKFEIGVVIVVDKKTKDILYFSDGGRSFYFLTDGDNILEAGSMNRDGDEGYFNKGWMVFDFDGVIKENHIPEMNKEKRSSYYNTRNSPQTHWTPADVEEDDIEQKRLAKAAGEIFSIQPLQPVLNMVDVLKKDNQPSHKIAIATLFGSMISTLDTTIKSPSSMDYQRYEAGAHLWEIVDVFSKLELTTTSSELAVYDLISQESWKYISNGEVDEEDGVTPGDVINEPPK